MSGSKPLYPPEKSGVERRGFLGASLATGVVASSLMAADRPAAKDLNRLKIDAYTDQMSYLPGESAALHISTNFPAQVNLQITRLGAKPEVVWQKTDLNTTTHPVPAKASQLGCDWPAALKIPLAAAWRSGIYGITFQGKAGDRQANSETFFIIRNPHPGRDAKILFQVATNTYQAYNNWGGSCLYSGPKYPRVSFNRPFQIYLNARKPKATWYNPNNHCHHTWDVPFIEWAERAGYALDYCANLDLELHSEILKSYKLVLSVGHDEYWSAGMRDQLEQYIGNGGNVAFLSGNSVCWQVRVEDQGRALVCYKRSHELDPISKTDDLKSLTTLWGDALLKRPENQLTGVGFAFGGYNAFYGEFEDGTGAGEYTVHRPDHWLLAGTGLKQGQTFGRLNRVGDQQELRAMSATAANSHWWMVCPFRLVATEHRGIWRSSRLRLRGGVAPMAPTNSRRSCDRDSHRRHRGRQFLRIRWRRTVPLSWACTSVEARWLPSAPAAGLMGSRTATK